MIDINISKELHGTSKDMLLDVNIKIQKHDFLALTGQSGSGKTTLLRILAGLDMANGEIKVDNEIWQNHNTFLPPQKRKIGFVFQNYALFPNKNVIENLLFVSQDKDLADHLLKITELKELSNRYPDTLSGGQKQRVSICRALMGRPKILLMDEPLSALDSVIRDKLQNEILSLHEEFKTTTILVTHNPDEIYRLSNRMVILKNGKIVEDSTPSKILLKTNGSQKFSFEGKLLDIVKKDVINVAIIAIGAQIVEVVISTDELKGLKIGDIISISTKAFSPNISKN